MPVRVGEQPPSSHLPLQGAGVDAQYLAGAVQAVAADGVSGHELFDGVGGPAGVGGGAGAGRGGARRVNGWHFGQALADVCQPGFAGAVLRGLLLGGQGRGAGWCVAGGCSGGALDGGLRQRWGVEIGFEEVALGFGQHPLGGGQGREARLGGLGAHVQDVAVGQRVFAVALALGVEQADGVGIDLASGQR